MREIPTKEFGSRNCSKVTSSKVRNFALAIGDTSLPAGVQADMRGDSNYEAKGDVGKRRKVSNPKEKRAYALKGRPLLKGLTGNTTFADPGRYKRESNFFVTINLNKSPGAGSGQGVAQALEAALQKYCGINSDRFDEEGTKVNEICKYLVFGPVNNDVYGNDKYEDVIDSVDVYAGIERGPQTGFVHAHVWLTFHHYSQIQINCKVLGQLIKDEYNRQLPRFVSDQVIRKYFIKPHSKLYCNVKLLPQSDFADVIRGYVIKSWQDPAYVVGKMKQGEIGPASGVVVS